MHTDFAEIRNFSLFVLASLLLHMLLLTLPKSQGPVRPAEKPVYVEIQSPPPDMITRELDLPEQPNQERDKPAERLGPADRVVEKETAPKGDAPEDRLPAITVPVQPPQPQPQPDKPPPVEDGTQPVPDLKTLTTLPQDTRVRIGDEFRTKARPDVAEGEAIWLDTEQDILISFFQRLRNGIYQNWNYPSASLDRGEQGACLIEMVFDRDGNVLDVVLLQTSGFPLLDREAIAAVYKGSDSYGRLPKAYTEDQLRIKAFFTYNLDRRPTIFGQQ